MGEAVPSVLSNSCVRSVRESLDVLSYVTCARFHQFRPELLAEDVKQRVYEFGMANRKATGLPADQAQIELKR